MTSAAAPTAKPASFARQRANEEIPFAGIYARFGNVGVGRVKAALDAVRAARQKITTDAVSEALDAQERIDETPEQKRKREDKEIAALSRDLANKRIGRYFEEVERFRASMEAADALACWRDMRDDLRRENAALRAYIEGLPTPEEWRDAQRVMAQALDHIAAEGCGE